MSSAIHMLMVGAALFSCGKIPFRTSQNVRSFYGEPKVLREGLVGIRILPEELVRDVAEPLELRAIGSFRDSSESDITEYLAWESSDPAVIELEDGGTVKRRAAGLAFVRATDLGSGLNAEVSLRLLSDEILSYELVPDDLAALVDQPLYFQRLAIRGGFRKTIEGDESLSFRDLGFRDFELLNGRTARPPLQILGPELLGLEIDASQATTLVSLPVKLKVQGRTKTGELVNLSNLASLNLLGNESKLSVELTREKTGFVVTASAPGSYAISFAYDTFKTTFDLAVVGDEVVGMELEAAEVNLVPNVDEEVKVFATTLYRRFDVSEWANWQSASATNFQIARPGFLRSVSSQSGSSELKIGFQKFSVSALVKSLSVLLKSLVIEPNLTTLEQQGTAKLQAKAYFSDDRVVDVTRSVTWVTDNPSLASVLNRGNNAGTIVSGNQLGRAKISAVFGNLRSQAEVVVVKALAVKAILLVNQQNKDFEVAKSQTLAISWSSEGASACQLYVNDALVRETLLGTLEVSANVDTTVVLRCRNDIGEDLRKAVTASLAKAPFVDLKVNGKDDAETLEIVNQGVKLSWKTSGAKRCQLYPENVEVDRLGSVQTGPLRPGTITEFIVRCNGLGGESSDTIKVSVKQPPCNGYFYEGACWVGVIGNCYDACGSVENYDAESTDTLSTQTRICNHLSPRLATGRKSRYGAKYSTSSASNQGCRYYYSYSDSQDTIWTDPGRPVNPSLKYNYTRICACKK